MKTLRLAIQNEKYGNWYELYKEACPICGHVGWCMIHEDQNRVVCARIESKFPWGQNGHLYLHYLNGKAPKKYDLNHQVVKNHPKLDDNQLDRVFRSFIQEFPLLDDHYQHLTGNKRQMTDSQIYNRGYVSFPNSDTMKPWTAIRRVAGALNVNTADLLGVPGVYKFSKGKEFINLKGFSSMMVPFRNAKNQIVGLQLRKDTVDYTLQYKDIQKGVQGTIFAQPNVVGIKYKGKKVYAGKPEIGTWTPLYDETTYIGSFRVKKGQKYVWLSSKTEEEGAGAGNPTPVHVALPCSQLPQEALEQPYQTKAVWLTEGPFKCDIASDLVQKCYPKDQWENIGHVFIGVPGVNQWREAVKSIEAMNASVVQLAFDADAARNPDVYKYLLECAKHLKQKGIHVNLMLWNEKDGKGIDDLLLKNLIPHIKPL